MDEKSLKERVIYKNEVLIRGFVSRKTSSDTGTRLVIAYPRVTSKKTAGGRDYQVTRSFPIISCGVNDARKVSKINAHDYVEIRARAYSGINNRRPDTFFSLQSIEKVPSVLEKSFGIKSGFLFAPADMQCVIGGEIIKTEKKEYEHGKSYWTVMVETERSASESNIVRIKYYTNRKDVEKIFPKGSFIQCVCEVVTGTAIVRNDPADVGHADPDSGYACLILRDFAVIDENGIKLPPAPAPAKKKKTAKSTPSMIYGTPDAVPAEEPETEEESDVDPEEDVSQE